MGRFIRIGLMYSTSMILPPAHRRADLKGQMNEPGQTSVTS